MTPSDIVPWWQVTAALAITVLISGLGTFGVLWVLRHMTERAARRERARRGLSTR